MSSEEISHNFLAKNLKFLRKKLKVSQEQLSQDLHITRNKIASYESRNIEPKLELISKIAEYFNIKIDDLIKTEITEDNYKTLVDNKTSKVKTEETPVELNLNIKKRSAIADFIKENVKIGKIINGFKAFQEIKKDKDLEAKEIGQIMEVLDYLMETNKNLILEINSTIEKENV